MEARTEVCGLLLQGGGLCALRVESSCGDAEAFLSSGSQFEEVGLLLELLAALGVGVAQGGSFFF